MLQTGAKEVFSPGPQKTETFGDLGHRPMPHSVVVPPLSLGPNPTPRSSTYLVAKPRTINSSIQAHQVLIVKLGLVDRAHPVNSADMHKYESMFTEMLSEA